ncbi:DUF2235 domain-containing protein [Achromobacter sp. GG226]|uniref:DUF6531 domain-containing protein n=1 Tax=Verticiella alkaliphila TaxID=2779529 RepID=UPI001C0E1781|nr:DUF6531 domain-containing protein [Verticiella sp. GG226]MBU4612510.1 DUF2235 domain-containing protein [Verticiella sp. GG226]
MRWSAAGRCTMEVLVALCLGLAGSGAIAQGQSCGPSQLGSPCGEGGPASLPAEGPSAAVGNPVHLATGNKYQREVDLPALPGALGLELVRHYNAGDPRIGAFGQAWQLSYDTRLHDAGRQISIVQPDGTRLDFLAGETGEAPCVPLNPAHGEVRRVTGEGSERYVWTWRSGRRLSFDAEGRLVAITAPLGGRVVIVRGRVQGAAAYGRAVRVTDPSGRSLQLTYAGSPARVVRAETPAGVIAYQYDREGGLVGVSYPDGHVRTYEYDATLRGRGRLAMTARGVRRPDGGQTVLGAWRYDSQGRVVETYAGAPGDPASLLRLDYARTPAGWRTAVTDAVGRRSQADLASGGARHVLTRMTGAACPGCTLPGTIAAYSPAGALLAREVHAVARDALGRPVQVGGAGGFRLRWLEDTTLVEEIVGSSVMAGKTRALTLAWTTAPTPHGPVRVPVRVAERGWQPTGEGDARALTRSWALTWRWHEDGMRLAGAEMAPAGAPPARTRPARRQGAPAGWPGAEAQWDDFGQVVRWRSTATGEEVREHDEAGRLTARRFANGQRWQYAYDAHGQLVQIDLGEQQVRIGWADALPTQIVHPDEAETRGYDAQGRLTSRTVRRPAEGPARLAYTERFERDAQGRIVTHRLPEGGALHYAWGEGRRLQRLVWEDSTGRLTPLVTLPATGAGFALGNGVTVQPRLTSSGFAGVDHRLGSAVVLDHSVQQAQGQVVAESVETASGRTAMTYAYDREDRLVVEAWATTRGDMGHARRQWSADGAAQVSPVSAVMREASGLPRQIGERTLQYGPSRRLAAVEAGGRPLIAYRHNAYGEQIRREPAEGAANDFLYVGQRLAAIWQDGGVVRRYVYANDAPVAMIDYAQPQTVSGTEPAGWGRLLVQGPALTRPALGRVFYLHADAIGLVRAVTDASGTLQWQGEFDAFGALLAAQGERDPGLRLPGQWHDPVTGWHDNYLRTYDPGAGHYLEPDPLGPAPWLASVPGVVARTSAYGYAAQQPRRHADPLGLVLFAFEGTFSVLREPTNVAQFALLYGDSRHPDAKTYLITAPGDASDSPLIDAATGGTGPEILQAQWDRLITHLSELGTGGPAEAIDLVGYSRGAALARHFANEIAAQVRQGRFWQWVAGVGAVTACVDLRFMGLFDTVAQFGALGSKDPDYDFTIAPDWSLVAHAVSLHEQRLIMGLTLVANADGTLPANAVEMPFVGSHGDIGGGFGDPTGNYRDLSDIPLAWMLARAREAGVPMREALAAQQIVSDPTLNDKRSTVERVSEQWRAEIAAGLGLTDVVPPSLILDRPVRAADSTVLVDSAADHPFIGPARAETEAFIHRFRDWRTSGKEEVGIVDLEAYAKWLAARGIDGTWRAGGPPD